MFLILLSQCRAYYKPEYSVVLSTEDLSFLVDFDVVSSEKALEIWEVLLKKAEGTNPTKYSSTGFSKSGETLLLGLVSVSSIVISLGSIVMLLCLFSLIGYGQSLQNIWISCAITGFGCFLSSSIGYILYESYGNILVCTGLVMSAGYFMYIFLETIAISLKIMNPDQHFLDFSMVEAGIFAIVLLCNYYYCLLIAFPLIQIPFFLGLAYFATFAGLHFTGKVSETFQPLPWIVLSTWSGLTIIYMLIFKANSFILIGSFPFVDFRLIGFFICGLFFIISVSQVIYFKYCKLFNTQVLNFLELIRVFSHFETSEKWQPYHNYVLGNICIFAVIIAIGSVFKISSLVFLGYLGSTFLLILLPKATHSVAIYNVLVLVAIVMSAILGHIEDKLFLQITVFFPRSYILGFLLVIVRVGGPVIGIINANLYKSGHFMGHSSADIVMDFILSYLRTITLIALCEVEENWVMSWVYNVAIVLNLDPTIRIESESYTDEVIRMFSLLMYGVRLSLVGYQLFIPYYSGVFLIFLGFYKANSYSLAHTQFQYLTFIYAWAIFNFACCIGSWIIFTTTFILIASELKKNPEKKPNFLILILASILLLFLYFTLELSQICFFTLKFTGLCDYFMNANGYFLEKDLVMGLIKYFK